MCGDYFINHYRDPGSLLNNQYFMECYKFLFFVAQVSQAENFLESKQPLECRSRG